MPPNESRPMTPHLHRPALDLVATLAAALLVAGCTAPQKATEDTGEGQQVSEAGSTPDAAEKPTKEKPGAKLEKTGIGRDGDYGWVSAIVSNTSSENVGRFVTVQFNMMDAKGKLVASQDQVEAFTSETQTLAIGTQVELVDKPKITKVEATLGLGDKASTDDMPNLSVGKVKVKQTEYEGRQASFEVKNPAPTAQKSARIGVVCLNKSGKIIGGGSDYPDLIPAKGHVLVEASVITSGKPSHCEAYAAPSTF